MKILVTGSSGLIGPNIIKLLNDRHQFSGLDKNLGSLDIDTTLADAANINEILKQGIYLTSTLTMRSCK